MPDDVFIASYPKSGNTWMRFIVASLQHRDDSINFTNIHLYSPEVGKSCTAALKAVSPRLIKTHGLFNPSLPKVIYLVRDGRDVYVSYYYYLKNSLPSDMSFREFLRDWPLPFGRWSDHVLSWLDNFNGGSMLVIRYEELHEHAQACVRRVADFMGLHVDDESIEEAVGKTTFLRMKEAERTFGRGAKKTGPEIFMRKGVVGDWQNLFDEEAKNVFKKRECGALIRLGYEDNVSW